MSARFEIVRTDDGHHARLVSSNGQIIMASEVYTRRVGAERAVLSAARILGYEDPRLTVNVGPPDVEEIVEKILTAADPARPHLSVTYVDEREAGR